MPTLTCTFTSSFNATILHLQSLQGLNGACFDSPVFSPCWHNESTTEKGKKEKSPDFETQRGIAPICLSFLIVLLPCDFLSIGRRKEFASNGRKEKTGRNGIGAQTGKGRKEEIGNQQWLSANRIERTEGRLQSFKFWSGKRSSRRLWFTYFDF